MGNDASVNVPAAAVAWGASAIVGIGAIVLYAIRERALSKAYHRVAEVSQYWRTQANKAHLGPRLERVATLLMDPLGGDSDKFTEMVETVTNIPDFESKIADCIAYLSYQIPAAVVRGVGNSMLFVIGGGFNAALVTAIVWSLLWGNLGYTVRTDGVEANWLLWGGFGLVYACIIATCLFMTHVYTTGSKLMVSLFFTIMAGAVGASLLGASLISVQTSPVFSQYSWFLWSAAVLFQLAVLYGCWCALGPHALIDPPTKEMHIHVKFVAYNWIRGAALAAWLIVTAGLICFALSPENTQTSSQAASISESAVQVWMSVEYAALLIIPLVMLMPAAKNYYDWTSYMWRHRMGILRGAKMT
jgi:hypothetical protein